MPNQDHQQYEKFDTFDEFFQQSEKRLGYWVELAKLDFTREVVCRMKQLDISRSQLAQKLEVQPALVTRLLSGRNNFELATMVKLALVLDCEFRSHLQPKGTNTMWLDILHEEPVRPTWRPDEFKPVMTETGTLCNESIAVAA